MADVVNAVADVDVVIAGAVGLEGGRQWRVIVAKKNAHAWKREHSTYSGDKRQGFLKPRNHPRYPQMIHMIRTGRP
jgi:hypothetical protein